MGVTVATDALIGTQGDEDADAVMVKPAMVSVWKTSRENQPSRVRFGSLESVDHSADLKQALRRLSRSDPPTGRPAWTSLEPRIQLEDVEVLVESAALDLQDRRADEEVGLSQAVQQRDLGGRGSV